jgi:thiamine pyrophosphate-dependent acetolactate synthase large subunit-like protein
MTHSPDRRALDRRAVVARLMQDRQDLIVISSLGAPTYDLAAAGDHPRNFYLWGAMGGAAQMGLGLALAQPDVPIAVLVGDGEMLMGMGGFATIAQQAPTNLSILILDNALYGETGGQQSHTASQGNRPGVDLAAVAAACGIPDCRTLTEEAELASLAERINRIGEGPLVAVIKIDGEDKPRCLPSRDGVWLKARLRAELGFDSM